MKNISDEITLIGYIKNILDYKNSSSVPVAVESLDDCALIKISESDSMAITSDFIRGSGFYLFELGLLNYYDVGYYLISANLSDLASVGAKPIGLTTIVRYSDKMDDTAFKEVFNGMKDSADVHSAMIVGGDIGGYSADVLAATAFGIVKTEDALLRKNVKEGDLLCITGPVGLAITALTYFKEVKKTGFSFTEEEEGIILNAWKRPQAKIKEGLLLRENKYANACQDISDGLKATIEQMSDISNKRFTIYAEKLPIHDTTIKLANHLNINPIQIAISASVDFELMFTMPPEKLTTCKQAFERAGLSFIVIGETNNKGKNILVNDVGKEEDLPGVAWKQQRGGEYLKTIITK